MGSRRKIQALLAKIENLESTKSEDAHDDCALRIQNKQLKEANSDL